MKPTEYLIEMEIDDGKTVVRDMYITSSSADSAIEQAFDELRDEFKGKVAFFKVLSIRRLKASVRLHTGNFYYLAD